MGAIPGGGPVLSPTIIGVHSGTRALGDKSRSRVEMTGRASGPRQAQVSVQEGARVSADRALIRSALDNLLGNARKFTARRDRAATDFATAPAGDAPLCCYVRDNGAGFDPAHVGNLFQPFHHAAEFPGTGTGLAAVRRIIERHGGRAWAEGTVDGRATINFTLNAESTP